MASKTRTTAGKQISHSGAKSRGRIATSPSAKFEQQIERLHRLLEQEGSEVTWNDHLPDPDNPKQPRQIDVTIRRDGRLTLSECRIHKSKQNVKWIEELMGRRESLKADGVIAVSASGFTKGAINKANRFGIILRTLKNLSEEEIKNWGKLTTVTVVYYEFSNAKLTLRLPKVNYDPEMKVTAQAVTQENGEPIIWRGIFEATMKQLDDNSLLDSHEVEFSVDIFAPLLVHGIKPIGILFESKIRRITQKIMLSSVVAYAAGDEETEEQYAHVARYDLGAFEILQNADEVAIVADTSSLTPPPNCILRTINMDFGRGVEMRWLKPLGLLSVLLHGAALQLQVVFC